MKRISIITMVLLCVFTLKLAAQRSLLQSWYFPDLTISDQNGKTHRLYDYLQSGKMVYLVAGHTDRAGCADLLSSATLQKLYQDHGPKGNNNVLPYTSNDIQVLFIDLDDNTKAPNYNFPYTSLSKISTPVPAFAAVMDVQTYLITTDRMARPVSFRNAVEAYNVAAGFKTSYKPESRPDLRIVSCTTPGVMGNNFNVTVNFQNFSTEPLERVRFRLYNGSELISEQVWKGNMDPLEAQSISLNGSVVNPENVYVEAIADNDIYGLNNKWEISSTQFYSAGKATNLPYEASVHTGTLPAGWISSDDGVFQANTKSTSQQGIKIAFAEKMPGQTDTLFIGNYNLASFPVLQFDHAYAPSSPFSEASLQLIVSDDEGKTWQQVKTWDNKSLSTVGQQSYSYFPRNMEEWKKDRVNLSQVAGRKNVWIALVATADFTNEAYIAHMRLQDEPQVTAHR